MGSVQAPGAPPIGNPKGPGPVGTPTPGAAPAPGPAPVTGSPAKAWLPWILLSGFVFLWGLPPVQTALNDLFAAKFNVPGLHLAVTKVPPVEFKSKST